MDREIIQEIAAWQTFYVTLAGITATLTGLLFVAVSLNIRLFTSPQRRDLRAVGWRTFTGLLFVLLCALFFLFPQTDPGLFLFVTALFGLRAWLRFFYEDERAVGQVWGRRFFLWRVVVVPCMCITLTGLAGLGMLWGATTLYPFVPFLFVLLLFISAWNAWDLLLQVGADEQAQRPADGDPQLRRLEQQLREVTRRQRRITRQQEEATRTGEWPPRRRG